MGGDKDKAGWTQQCGAGLLRWPRSSDSRRQRQRRMLATACLLGIVVSVLLLLAKAGNGIHNPGRVLLVTAHPDDETIFFAPVATSLHTRGLQVFLLCLTNGGAHGLGDLRQRELTEAAQQLQIDAAHLTVLNDTRIQDGHNEAWEEEYVANIVRNEVARRGINTIITFDAAGVTGHKNHEGCYNGVRHYVSDCQRSGGAQCPSAWALETTDNFRKFSSVFDILPSAVEARARDDTVIFLNSNVLGMFKAMCAHKSQSRWWRHVLLTRYTFVNTLERMKPLVLDWAAPLPNNKERKAAGVQPPALAASSSASTRVLQPSTKFAAAAVALPPTAYADSYFRYPAYKAHPQDAGASVPASGTWAAAAAAAAVNGPAKGRAPLDVRHSAAAASKKRNAFLTRMSRRVARNMLLR